MTGLEITLPRCTSRSWFTAGESVCGTVHWTAKRSTIVSKLTVHLEGILVTSAKPVTWDQDNWHISSATHVLLTRSHTLYPPSKPLSSRHNTFGPGHHAFEFCLTLPNVGREDLCCSKCESGLPPSFTFAADGVKAAVHYQIRVVLERVGLLKPTVTKVLLIQYKPLLPFFYSPDAYEWNCAGWSDVPIAHLNSEDAGRVRTLARRASVVTLEVRLLGPKVLQPGRPANLIICLMIPPELRHFFMPTWIFGISIRLKARTIVTAAMQVRAHIGHLDICNIKAIIPVQITSNESCVMLPSALWEHSIYPMAIPTFHLCTAERTYQLEVTVDFACSKAVDQVKATTLIDVEVESGVIDVSEPPPEYRQDAP